MGQYRTDCRYFSGYKPCKFKRACDGCTDYQPTDVHIGIISLEALGAVLRSTCLLPPIRRTFPKAFVTWITYPNAVALLENNPEIDRVIALSERTQSALSQLIFDRLFCVDKSIEAGGLALQLQAKKKFGFGISSRGAIVPLNPEAQYLYDLGLNDQLKFHLNSKPETQLITEAMGFEWKRDEYRMHFTATEAAQSQAIRDKELQNAKGIIGFNTGCSTLFPYKKFTVERSIENIRAWRQRFPGYKVFLLGGREDTERQMEMKRAFEKDDFVVNTPTNLGMRQGAVWIDACDMLLSGDSLGMHIAIARQKPVIAWFGLSCSQEIDVYDRGEKLKADVSCGPCWKRSCDNVPKCFDMVPVQQVIQSTERILIGP